MGYWLVILIGLIGGVAVGIQSPIAGAMGQKLGGTASSFIIHLSGMIFSGILLFVSGGERIRDWRTIPWYMLGAGIFGLILYQTISVTLPRLGSTMMITLIIIGQLLVGIIIDHFGLLGVATRHIDIFRVMGVIALLIGGFLIAR
ncbi:MAG: DMT family transporter [Anaerolineales bacterium]|jgi:transporter family-2 protein